MLKMMAQENMDNWNNSPLLAVKVVKITYDFLNEEGNLLVTALQISDFLSWGIARVEDAMATLRAMGKIPESPYEKENPSMWGQEFRKSDFSYS